MLPKFLQLQLLITAATALMAGDFFTATKIAQYQSIIAGADAFAVAA